MCNLSQYLKPFSIAIFIVVVSTQETAETTDLSANAPASEASAEQPNQEKAAK